MLPKLIYQIQWQHLNHFSAGWLLFFTDRCLTSTWKYAQHHHCQGNATQNHTELSPYFIQNGCNQKDKKQKAKAGDGV
jgi:hypothetical protein